MLNKTFRYHDNSVSYSYPRNYSIDENFATNNTTYKYSSNNPMKNNNSKSSKKGEMAGPEMGRKFSLPQNNSLFNTNNNNYNVDSPRQRTASRPINKNPSSNKNSSVVSTSLSSSLSTSASSSSNKWYATNSVGGQLRY